MHVVDVTRGLPAAGMKVEIFALEPKRLLVAGQLSPNGVLEHPIASGAGVDRGRYEVVFQVGEFYRQLAYPLPDLPFLDAVPFQFGMGDAAQHYHLPLKVSPWGFSLFRGG